MSDIADTEQQRVSVERQVALKEDKPTYQVQAVSSAPTPAQMLMAAVEKGASVEQIQQFIALKKEWEADEARKAYFAAMAAFKKNPPVVVKDLLNKQYGSMYASLGNFSSVINQALGEHELSADFDVDQQDKNITVVCTISHSQGHQKSTSITAPIDTSGQKNPIQQIKSTITYLTLATLQAATGIIAQDKKAEDDGNSASCSLITDEQLANIQALAEEVGANMAQFLKFMKIEELDELPASKYEMAVNALERKRKQ